MASKGILSDEDFFRLVTCGAPPAGACQGPSPRWRKSELTLSLVLGDTAMPPDFEDRLRQAADHAIAQINAVGAGIRLRRVEGQEADITLRPTELKEGARLADVPGFSGPGVMGVGYMTLWWDESLTITQSVILISTSISNRDMTSVLLEETTQSLGLLYDIENPAYEGVSILSQTSNATTTLAGQDAMALLRLYPPKD